MPKIVFIDVETVGVYKDISEFDENTREKVLKDLKRIDGFPFEDKVNMDAELNRFWNKKAGLTSYTKTICVSAVVQNSRNPVKMSFKNFEKLSYFLDDATMICGHNVFYDVRKIAQEYIVQGLEIPKLIVRALHCKPWQINAAGGFIYDTALLSKTLFGRIMGLEELSLWLGLGSSKSGEVKGENMHEYFWSGGDVKKIEEYCEEDCVVTSKVFQKLAGIIL